MKHVAYVHPRYVLSAEDVTLFSIEAKQSTFCKMGGADPAWPKPMIIYQIARLIKIKFYAWFLGLPVPSVPSTDTYDVDKYPFVFMAQYIYCKYLVILPNSSLERLAEEEVRDLNDDPRTIAIINMTMRSGSTLLCQVKEKGHFEK